MSIKSEAASETTSTTTNPPVPSVATAPAPPTIITPPVIIGTLTFDPATNISTITAKWAMNQAMMDSKQENSTNDCSYQGKGRMPESLNGHFYMYIQKTVKRKTVMKNTQYVESINKLTFTPKEGSTSIQEMKGEGTNRFGAFTLNGTLAMNEGENHGKFTMFKHYLPQQPKKKRATKNTKLRGPLGNLQGGSYTPPLGRRSSSDRKRKANSKFTEQLNEPEVTLKGPLKKCERLLIDLMKGGQKNKKAYSDIFLNPVSLETYKSYEDDIKPSKPICFNDIKRKLYKGFYKSYDFFANDVRRVFHNAFVFNRDQKLGFAYQAAVHLSTEFENKMSKIHGEEVDREKREALKKAQIEEEIRLKKERARLLAIAKRKREAEIRQRKRQREIERRKKKREKERERKRKEKERQKRAAKAAKKAAKSQKRGKGSKRRRNSSANSAGALTQEQINQLLAASGGQNQLALMKQVEWMRNEIAQLKQNGASGGGSGSEPANKKARNNNSHGKGKSRAPKRDVPKVWDFNAKAELTEKINLLLTQDEAYMEIIMQMIQDYSDIQVEDDEEMELDIDNLNVNCLNQLDKFVTKSNNEIRRKNQKERAKARRRQKAAEERARKQQEQEALASQRQHLLQQQQQQPRQQVSMFGGNNNNSNVNNNLTMASHSNNSSSLLGGLGNTSAVPPPPQKQMAYVESDDDNEEELAVSGAGGNFEAEFDTGGSGNLWNQMASNNTGDAKKGNEAQQKQQASVAATNFEDEEEFDAGF